MKKLIGILFTAILLAFCTTALAEANLQAIEAANAIRAVLDLYSSTVQRVVSYDLETGEVADSYDIYMAKGQDGFLTYTTIFADGSVQSYGNGGGYGYIAESKQPYVCSFAANAYEEYMQRMESQNLGEFAEGQVITSETTSEDGKLLVVTEGNVAEDDVNYGQTFAGSTLVVKYKLNPENLIIESFDAYIRGEDQADHLCFSAAVERDPVLTLPFDDSPIRNPAALREIHMILDPGTDAEKDWVLTAPLNLPSALHAPDGYEYYDDAACTIPAGALEKDAEGNYPQTVTVYCAPVKE